MLFRVVLILFLLVPPGHGSPLKELTTLSNLVKKSLHTIPDKVSRAGDLFSLGGPLVPRSVGKRNNGVGIDLSTRKNDNTPVDLEIQNVEEIANGNGNGLPTGTEKMKVLPKTQQGGSPTIVDFVDAKQTVHSDFSTRPGIDEKTNPTISNKSETERDITSVPEYKDVGKLNGTSDKTSVLWSEQKLESFTEDELDKEISNICNSFPIGSGYTGLTKIVQGDSATVFRGRNKTTNEVVSIKVIEIDNKDVLIKKRMVLVELKVSKSFIHENIISFIDAHSQSVTKKLTVSLVMEDMTGGSLDGFLGEYNYNINELRMTEEEIASVCVQVLKGLKCLHDSGVFHRDIKPENIMLRADGLVKLCDFGWAANSREKHNQLAGSPYWAAPEVIQLLEYNRKSIFGRWVSSSSKWLMGSHRIMALQPRMS